MKSEVSALMDGALDERAATSTLNALTKSADLRRDWDTWLLIGEHLRQPDRLDGAPCAAASFTERCMLALAQEPQLWAPPRSTEPLPRSRLLMPLAASAMGVAAVGWVAMTLGFGAQAPAQVAAVQRPLAVRAAAVKELPLSVDRAPAIPPAMQPAGLKRPVASEYVVAHEAHSVAGSMQGRYQRGQAEAHQGAGH